MTVHNFETTGEAYDATQCDENIKDGDVLIIESEKVVGVAYTWPFAVTIEHGDLHRIKVSAAEMAKGFAAPEWMATIEAIKLVENVSLGISAAMAEAIRRGWEVQR